MARCAECPYLDGGLCDKSCGIDIDHPKLRDTDNGPMTSYEEDLLRQYFGEPDENGVYGAGELA